jgi:diguanylate cyclase (GGDEF)-like protein
MAVTDPLTGLRNHRAFHEDIARGLHRVGRTGVPLALVMLDLDGLKHVNDTVGHQAGDARIRALANAVRSAKRAGDTGYRTGGDEFAVLLDGVGSWDALAFVNRLHAALADGSDASAVTASAGISAALELTDKETLIREADLALLAAKRLHQDVAIYTPEMAPRPAQAEGTDDGHHSRTLANALARAVDAKDSYTRSHCQTVSQLCALIGAELGLEGEHLSQMRLAGLLHDVGKIGIADAILKKPAALTDDEYRQMQAHSLLGHDIMSAAELGTEAGWVLHHHERYDGGGYPDGLAGERIPLESRIILAADAYEAMTSDRPYRRAPGREFAIAELRRHAGTQFDTRVVDALCRVLHQASTDGEGRRSAVAA